MSSQLPPEYQAAHPLSMGREGRTSEWFQANARAVSLAGAALALAVVGSVAWRTSERSKGRRAEQALFQAEAGGAGDPRQAEQALRGVVSRYSGTAGGAQAQLLLAQSLYDQGRYQDGITVLGRGKPPAEFAESVQLLTAAGYEGLGRGGDAARIYETVANSEPRSPQRRSELRAAAARAYALANDRPAALRIWRQIVLDGTGSAVDEARVRVGELAGATNGANKG